VTTEAWLTLVALVTGPVVAVLITLYVDGRRKVREARVGVLRALISTRHLPGDPIFSAAINLVPVEFNNDRGVMTAWNAFIAAWQVIVPDDAAEKNEELIRARLTSLIFKIMLALGFKLPETEIQTSAFSTPGMIARDALYLDYLRATREIADALKEQTRLIGAGQPQGGA
jgi:hypothetical protein